MATENLDNGNAGDGETPKPLTEEDIGRVVGPMINAAITGHMKRTIPGAIQDGIKALNLESLIGEAVQKVAPPKPEDEEGKKRPVPTAALQAELNSIKEQLETERKARAVAEQERVDTHRARQFDAARNAFRAAVQDKVKPELLDVFVDHIGVSKKRLKVDEDGVPLLTVQGKPAYPGAPAEPSDLPLEQAIPLLLQSKDVSPFLPAPGGQQDGTGGSARAKAFTLPAPPTSGGAQSEQAKAGQVAEQLRARGIDPDILS